MIEDNRFCAYCPFSEGNSILETGEYKFNPSELPIQNFHQKVRSLFVEYLRENKDIPEGLKPEIHQFVVNHLSSISLFMGTLELMHRRFFDKE